METAVPITIAVAAAFLLALGAVADDRRARVRRRQAADPVPEPPLLHSINDDRCIGCEACIDVCPTEVLDLVDHKVRVARFSDCVQCEQCANACPTTALVMYRQGDSPKTLTVPELDDHFQTGVPGQYLIGEVAGKPLVKNAANLGRAVIEHLARDLASRPRIEGVLDVAIVGSGPGGLSAGLTCHRTNLSCVVIEKEHVLASTVARYPKGKLFMAEPVNAGNVSYLPVFDASKEELVAAWKRVVDGVKLPVKLGEAVDTVVRGDDGVFTIKTTVATYRARAVVLATGLRGKPRLLAVPGANLEKVKSRLDDPDELAGRHVLVVGGGDSAVEAAMSLSDAGATSTLSYRGDGFKRCKQGNQQRLAEMVADNKVRLLLESNVQEFTADAVTIKLKDGTIEVLPNHDAFVLIGADTPVAWLENNNVRFVEREHLYALGSTEEVVRKLVPDASECPSSPDEALAILLGRKAPKTKPSNRRLQSFVGHIQEELREAVTNVTGIFKVPDFGDKPITKTSISKVKKIAGTRGTHVGPAPKRPVAPPRLIPAAELTRPRPPSPTPTPKPIFVARPAGQNPFEPENTTRVSAFGKPPVPLAPQRSSDRVLPAPAREIARHVGRALAARSANPFVADPTTLETPRYSETDVEHTAVSVDRPVPEQNTTTEMPSLRTRSSDPNSRDAAAPPRPRPPAGYDVSCSSTVPQVVAVERARTFPPEPVVHGASYDSRAARGPRSLATTYHLTRAPRGTDAPRPARGTAVPPPIPRRKP